MPESKPEHQRRENRELELDDLMAVPIDGEVTVSSEMAFRLVDFMAKMDVTVSTIFRDGGLADGMMANPAYAPVAFQLIIDFIESIARIYPGHDDFLKDFAELKLAVRRSKPRAL